MDWKEKLIQFRLQCNAPKQKKNAHTTICWNHILFRCSLLSRGVFSDEETEHDETPWGWLLCHISTPPMTSFVRCISGPIWFFHYRSKMFPSAWKIHKTIAVVFVISLWTDQSVRLVIIQCCGDGCVCVCVSVRPQLVIIDVVIRGCFFSRFQKTVADQYKLSLKCILTKCCDWFLNLITFILKHSWVKLTTADKYHLIIINVVRMLNRVT